MTDENNAEDGELIRRGEAPFPAPARTAKHRTVDWLLSRLSRWPFSNRLYVKSLKTAQEVIQERTKLEEAIIGHGRTRGRYTMPRAVVEDKIRRWMEPAVTGNPRNGLQRGHVVRKHRTQKGMR
jgi:hypothetical protein